ncbi:hypothetical protein G4B88_028193 [Cannabis sativa]|uniref:DUF4283 domain-containing protein n=1 Tax=Cannabis sativa TaxID=3483 RepID=A0A7J6HWQ9_CANSA|nr:hypothetical protein G4B88_028193 [Cannabis sativa]
MDHGKADKEKQGVKNNPHDEFQPVTNGVKVKSVDKPNSTTINNSFQMLAECTADMTVGDTAHRLVTKLKMLKPILKELNKEGFSDIHIADFKANEELKEAQDNHLFEEALQVTTDDLTYRLDPGEIDSHEPQGKVLLGKFICKGNLGRTAIAGTLKKAWASLKGWRLKEDDEGILHFSFATKEDAWNVLQRRSWIICGAMLVIMPWPSWLTPTEVKFNKSPFCVRISGIPPFYGNKTNLEELARKVSPNYKLPRYIDFERGSFGMGTDPHGAFFPMFGAWMKHEEPARSPFSSPLPYWFEEWIIQKRLTVDQKFKQQWKMCNSLKIVDAWDARETRRQLPGKRRLVEQVMEELPATNEIRDTATLVVRKDPENLLVLDPQNDKHDGDSTIAPQSSGIVNGGITTCAQTDPISEEPPQPCILQTQVTSDSNAEFTSSSSTPSEALTTGSDICLLTQTDSSPLGPTRYSMGMGREGKAHRSYDNLLGSQAHELAWPSKDLWTTGFRALTGLGTVGKYMREPSLFNPLLDIEHFRSLVSGLGPKKRKALNGISIGPCPNKAPSSEISTHHGQTSCDATTSSQLTEQGDLQNKTSLTTTSGFSPGSSTASTTKRKRGRLSTASLTDHVKSPSESHEPSPPPRRRGRPSKSSLSCNSNSFILQKPWLLIRAYGPPWYGEKEAYWNGIGDFISDCILPVIIIGDLNGTLMDSECLNYATSSNFARYSFGLRRTVRRTGLIELGYQGVKYTWFRKGSRSSTGTCLKRARLNRALASVEWRLAWPKAIVNHLSASTSDHTPILLDTEGGRSYSKAQFKYELMSERDPRVFWVVKNAWAANKHRNPIVNMYRKIKLTKEHLANWNRNHFKKLSVQISNARFKLSEIEGSTN